MPLVAAAPGANVRKKWVLPGAKFKKKSHTPTFQNSDKADVVVV
jgi:hypothetical protein